MQSVLGAFVAFVELLKSPEDGKRVIKWRALEILEAPMPSTEAIQSRVTSRPDGRHTCAVHMLSLIHI